MNRSPEQPHLSYDEALSALNDLYDEVEAEIHACAPICEISGRCCRFREYGHDLFVSILERDHWLRSGEPAVAANDWRPGENCPWQSPTGLCTARKGRPLGCRVYFCDPKFAEAMPEITERAITRLKRITLQAGLPWDYRPAHRHLAETEKSWRPPAHARNSSEDFVGTTDEVRSTERRPVEGGS